MRLPRPGAPLRKTGRKELAADYPRWLYQTPADSQFSQALGGCLAIFRPNHSILCRRQYEPPRAASTVRGLPRLVVICYQRLRSRAMSVIARILTSRLSDQWVM